MAANQTVSQLNSYEQHVEVLTPRHGVVTLFGYGIRVCIDRGHLFIEDGIGANRRRCRLPRVGHGLKRLVVIGSDGMISLAALARGSGRQFRHAGAGWFSSRYDWSGPTFRS
jgi:hypothetical protein